MTEIELSSARAPAFPLVVHDPFFSVWLAGDTVSTTATTHWTGKAQGMTGLARIDGKPFRFLGNARDGADGEPMRQVGHEITPLRTIVRLEGGGVRLELTFTSPLIPEDLELLGRPVTYVDASVTSTDGQGHDVDLYLDFGAEWAVGEGETEIVWGRHRSGDTEASYLGAATQRPLWRSGDELQIDWGYLYASAKPGSGSKSTFGEFRQLRARFLESGTIPEQDDLRDARPLRMPAFSQGRGLAFAQSFTAGAAPQTWSLLVAYDQVWAASYFDRRLRPFWGRKGESAIGLIATSWAERDAVLARVVAYDQQLTQRLTASGGPLYARLGALSFRQCLAGHILIEDIDGHLLHFSKENSSNGSMGTIDVLYPASPFFLLFNPDLLEAQLQPVCFYAASGRWPFPFAPHDLGRYPLANGQNYGGGDRTTLDQMPVEECGNMLILAAALLKRTGKLDLVRDYFDVLATWADYLLEHGLDPENQLCTDDFAGHMPHNANLSIKAILGIGGFSQICAALGKSEESARYLATARDWAGQWAAKAADAQSYRLGFDQPGSWSQKYNLIWDRILGLDLFPATIAATEMAHYRQKLNRFGLPLDSRATYTKLDWLVWTACLTDKPEDFADMLAPVGAWLDAAPARVPLSDWYDTETGLQPHDHGFFARSVVGGVFIKLFLDEMAAKPGATAR
jgi:hypothetical protein